MYLFQRKHINCKPNIVSHPPLQRISSSYVKCIGLRIITYIIQYVTQFLVPHVQLELNNLCLKGYSSSPLNAPLKGLT